MHGTDLNALRPGRRFQYKTPLVRTRKKVLLFSVKFRRHLLKQPAMLKTWISVLLGCLAALSIAGAYNIDSEPSRVFSTSSDSEFGSSVSFHGYGSERYLLVGAPSASYTLPNSEELNTTEYPHKTGVLYRCALSVSALAAVEAGTVSECVQLPVDTTGEKPMDSDGLQEVKSNMRLGESVLSLGPNQPVIVCASHYGWTSPCLRPSIPECGVYEQFTPCNPGSNHRLYDPTGKCILLPSNLSSLGQHTTTSRKSTTTIAPTKSARLVGHDRTLFAWRALFHAVTDSKFTGYLCNGWGGLMGSMTGMALAATPMNVSERFPMSRIAMGGPATFQGSGLFWTFDVQLPSSATEPATLSSSSPPEVKNLRWHGVESAAGEHSTMTSYAIAHGDFDGDGNLEIAASQPGRLYTGSEDERGGLISSTVVIMNGGRKRLAGLAIYLRRDRPILSSIVGEQFGEFFGCSCISVDSNNDGISELLVGAPYWVDTVRAGESNAYDFGRVYFYSSNLTKSVVDTKKMKSRSKKETSYSHLRRADKVFNGDPASRFGWSLASVGDVDGDGYPDVAIGAPGETVNGVFGVGA
eukprot:scpid46044/ scgid1345/ Integrin alpha-8; Integrin alpha-8 heavy chain; Integrin alpha-8 light chain